MLCAAHFRSAPRLLCPLQDAGQCQLGRLHTQLAPIDLCVRKSRQKALLYESSQGSLTAFFSAFLRSLHRRALPHLRVHWSDLYLLSTCNQDISQHRRRDCFFLLACWTQFLHLALVSLGSSADHPRGQSSLHCAIRCGHLQIGKLSLCQQVLSELKTFLHGSLFLSSCSCCLH